MSDTEKTPSDDEATDLDDETTDVELAPESLLSVVELLSQAPAKDVNPKWATFLSSAQADIGDLTYDRDRNVCRIQTSKRWKQVLFESSVGGVVPGKTVRSVSTSDALVSKYSSLTITEVLGLYNSKLSLLTGLMQPVLAKIPNKPVLSINPQGINAVWLVPGVDIRVTTKLTFIFDADSVLEDIKAVVADNLGLTLSVNNDRSKQVEIVLQQTTIGQQVSSSSTGIKRMSTLEIKIKIPVSGFFFWITWSPLGSRVSMTEDPLSSDDLFSRISRFGAGAPDQSVADPRAVWSEAFPAIHLWSATVGKSTKELRWRIRLLVNFKSETGSDDHIVAMTYDSTTRTFTGSLVFSSSFPTAADRLLPSYDPRDEPPSGLDSKVLSKYDIVKFFSTTASSPAGLPTRVANAYIALVLGQKLPTPTAPQISLAFSLIAPNSSGETPGTPDKTEVPLPFSWNAVSLRATKQGPATALEFFTTFSLQPKDLTRFTAAYMAIRVTATADKTWNFTAKARNLNFGVMASFFETDYQESVVDILGKLTIRYLQVQYTFNRRQTQKASSFFMSGELVLGELSLDFIYQYARSDKPNPAASRSQNQELMKRTKTPLLVVQAKPGAAVKADWSFEASLKDPMKGATIGTVADSIIENASSKLPDVVKDIELDQSGTDRSILFFKISKAGPSVSLMLKITVSTFSVSFVQLSSGPGTKKQLLKASVDPFPMIRDIPLLGSLPQPFDGLAYHWIRDLKGDGGFTQVELNNINATLDPADKILYKATTSNKQESRGVVTIDNSGSPSVVLAPGHHFVVVDSGKVIVDHNFNNAKTGRTKDGTRPIRTMAIGRATTRDPPEIQADAAPSKGEIKKQTKLLDISNLGLQFKDGVLWVMIDASLELGPISLTLIGFGIGVPMSKLKLNKISSLTGNDLIELVKSIQWRISGLGVAFEKPPLILAGTFEHEIAKLADNTLKESYRGGIAVTFPPYVFVAVGEYSIITSADSKSNYKSVFVFPKLDEPLVQLEFGTISGVRLGFGYNSSVRSPSTDELYDFPFVNDGGIGGTGNNPAKILASMTKTQDKRPPWVQAKQDSYWFALGMTITAFEILSVTAVAMLGFENTGLTVSIFADAVAQLPAQHVPKEATILYIELIMVAEMDFGEGYFRVEAALAPTSFLLVPQCQLRGGFALCTWFGHNAYAGDFVFTIGGYHPAFPVPAWYPPVKRLGLSFTVGNNISVIGEGYFAITPKMAMGGARIHVSLDVGPVSAYLDASFDAMINFRPLHYVADMQVSVGVTFDADILFIHVHISASVGADLHIEGPEFGGRAHVDFYLFAFDVYFGVSNKAPDPINLLEFWDLVHKPGPDQGIQAVGH